MIETKSLTDIYHTREDRKQLLEELAKHYPREVAGLDIDLEDDDDIDLEDDDDIDLEDEAAFESAVPQIENLLIAASTEEEVIIVPDGQETHEFSIMQFDRAFWIAGLLDELETGLFESHEDAVAYLEELGELDLEPYRHGR